MPVIMWIVEVPGPPIVNGHPSWVRHRRVKYLPEYEMRLLLAELLKQHTAARAVIDGVEIVVTRRSAMVKRMSEETV